jgi:class 3 adenylate cyclase
MSETIHCDACGSENLPEQRFCGNCGSSLIQICPRCAAAAPPGSRFCGSCGAGLQSAAHASDAAAVTARPLEERRLATVLFADLSGFTALSGQTDHEDVRSLVDRCMGLIGEIVDRFDGHVDKVIGDAILAVWGAPTLREDHAERAVRAALEMRDSARTHQDEFAGLPLRIGVNTGELMFAPVGPQGHRAQTVMGDVVNVASRLQTSAPRGGVLVGEETWRETRRAIRYEQVEPFRIKGKAEPLDGWLAVEPVAAIPSERPLSAVPMVGRERELDVLSKTWQHVIEDRKAHFVVVLGAPGVGKSRLCRELRTAVEPQGARVIRSRSLPYGERPGYGAFAETVKQAAGIFDTDQPGDALAKLERHLQSVVRGAERAEVTDALGIMAGFGPGEVENRSVLFEAARIFVEGLGSKQSLVLGFEDLHWAEASLVDLIEHLAARVRDAPVLILASARPELLDARPKLGGGLPRYTALALDALGASATEQLTRELLRAHPVSPAVLERIGDVAGGNPLFIEELATSVAEGTTDPTQTLPTSVVSIIAARLDAMPVRERQLLLNAAVIGRTFSRNLLESLDPEPGFDDALEWLEDRDHIRRERTSEIEDDQAYSFRHMSLREVAYNTLPRAERRSRHATVARLAEQVFTDRPRTLSTILAHHWREAGDPERAIGYLVDAAEQADQAWAKREAVTLYTETLDLLPESDARRRSISLRRALANQAIVHIEFGDVAAPAGIEGAATP